MKLQCMGNRNQQTVWRFGQLLLLAALLALRAAAQAPNSQKQVSKATTSGFEAPSPSEVNHAITLAASYLERACGPDGRFVYRININSGEQSRSYNIVRHAGAIYALSMLQHTKPDQKAVDAMSRAAFFMRLNYIGPGVRPDQL